MPSPTDTRSAAPGAVAAVVALLVALAPIGCDRPQEPTDGATPDATARPALRAGVDGVGTAEAMRASVERLLDDDRPEDALAIARPLAEIVSDDWTAHELHARAATGAAIADRRRDGEHSDDLHREAAEAYRRAAELAMTAAPGAAGAMLRSAGMMLDATGDTDGALRQYERAARVDPLDPQTPLFAAQVHLRLGRLSEARILVDRVLALAPEEPWGWATRAELERLSGDAATALANIRTARRLDPGNHAIRLSEGRLLRLLDRPDDALTLLLALPEDERRERPFVEEIARAWSAAGHPQRGAEAWESLAEREPRRWRHRLEAARLWLGAGDPVRAGAALEPALLAAPDDPELLALRDAVGAAIAER